jgi:threonine synthase
MIPSCAATVGLEDTNFLCPRCGNLLDVAYDWERLPIPKSIADFERKWSRRQDPIDFSGVWRFHELLPFAFRDQLVSIGEGQTILQSSAAVGRYVGSAPGKLHLQYEGLNPSGSFKDNGMAAAFTHAGLTGAKRAACASTGNTSASLALFSAVSGSMRALVFVGSGKISYGKLAQALDHGALTLQIMGDFDDAMQRVQQVARRLGIYLVNSINPFRLEGQKTIMYRVLEGLGWEPPDWIVVPGGNLGNTSAFGKAFAELRELGLIKHIPRLAVINAAGADTLFQLYEQHGLRWSGDSSPNSLSQAYYDELDARGLRASTIASAIEINRPVNLPKALRALSVCGGVVRTVTDEEIMDAKAAVGAGGFGCEPASAASVAGARRLRAEGTIGADERVVCILTGHALKDPNATVAYHSFDEKAKAKGGKLANRPIVLPNDLEKIIETIESSA